MDALEKSENVPVGALDAAFEGMTGRKKRLIFVPMLSSSWVDVNEGKDSNVVSKLDDVILDPEEGGWSELRQVDLL